MAVELFDPVEEASAQRQDDSPPASPICGTVVDKLVSQAGCGGLMCRWHRITAPRLMEHKIRRDDGFGADALCAVQDRTRSLQLLPVMFDTGLAALQTKMGSEDTDELTARRNGVQNSVFLHLLRLCGCSGSACPYAALLGAESEGEGVTKCEGGGAEPEVEAGGAAEPEVEAGGAADDEEVMDEDEELEAVRERMRNTSDIGELLDLFEREQELMG